MVTLWISAKQVIIYIIISQNVFPHQQNNAAGHVLEKSQPFPSCRLSQCLKTQTERKLKERLTVPDTGDSEACFLKQGCI